MACGRARVNSTIKMLGITLAASTAFATTAHAQREGGYSAPPRQQQTTQPRTEQKEDKPQKGGAIVMLGDKKINISPQFATAYKAQVAAFDSKDTAGYPAISAAAHAAAKKPEEHFLASQIDLKAANAAKDEAGMGTALEAMIATGVFPQDQLSTAYTTLGKVKYNQKQFPQAIAAFQKAIELQPTNTEASTLLAQTKSVTATPAEAIAELQKAIAQGSANGGKPPEDVFKRAISVAYRAKMPVVQDLSRQWVAAYPSATNWRDALGIYRQMNNVDDQTTLDLFRLARAAKAMNGEGDYDRYAYAALMKGYPGEAKVVLDEGIAAGAVDPKKSPFKEMIQQATQKSAGEEATLDAAASKALAGGTAKSALTTGDLLYGYGRFDKAAELYRAALKRPGADASLTNLHLGMALARSGDKAGATAALSAVTGPRIDIAKYWLAYLATQA
jgi:tetratricopeptide (TPR) repeat protein